MLMLVSALTLALALCSSLPPPTVACGAVLCILRFRAYGSHDFDRLISGRSVKIAMAHGTHLGTKGSAAFTSQDDV